LPSGRYLGYADPIGYWEVLVGVGACGRITRVVIVTTVAFLIAAGCGPEKTPPPEIAGRPVVVAAGDIADCAREDDEATARIVSGIEGTVLTLEPFSKRMNLSEQRALSFRPLATKELIAEC